MHFDVLTEFKNSSIALQKSTPLNSTSDTLPSRLLSTRGICTKSASMFARLELVAAWHLQAGHGPLSQGSSNRNKQSVAYFTKWQLFYQGCGRNTREKYGNT